ncbi:type II toxin-antitoxin system HicA family toxin [Patescibacteria group bacterium AH-259-L07]|nr:type II toxin-antitoxin system HicA family toxin [Patescibacteria group bacterium AH-259-L07]
MGQRFPTANYWQVAKAARKLGFYLCRQAKGSHEIWRRDSDGRQATLVNHGSKELKRKTVKAILDDLGITPKKFLELK